MDAVTLAAARAAGDKRYSSTTVGNRLRRAAHSAARNNGIQLGVTATPPTITTASGANPNAALTNNFIMSSGHQNKFRITGGTATQVYSGTYVVAPSVTMPSGSGGNANGLSTKNAYGWTVEFYSDAPIVMMWMINTTNQMMVEVDDQPISATTFALPGGGGNGWLTLDFTSAGGAKVRKFRLELAYSAAFGGVYVGPTYLVWAPISETNLRVATVGDSLHTQTGASFPNGGWQKITGKLLGWTDVRQVAFGGTGFTNNGSTYNTFGAAQRIADTVAAAPDLLIMQASQNDDTATASATTTAALAAFQAYRTALPKVPIVVRGADASSSGPSAARKAMDTAVHAAFTQWADSNSWWVEDVNDPLGSWYSGIGTLASPNGNGNRDRYGFDSAHPNDAGHLYDGQRFANAFRSQVLGAIT